MESNNSRDDLNKYIQIWEDYLKTNGLPKSPQRQPSAISPVQMVNESKNYVPTKKTGWSI